MPTEDELVFIRAVKSGKRHLPEDARLALIAAIQFYQCERREEDLGGTQGEGEYDEDVDVDLEVAALTECN